MNAVLVLRQFLCERAEEKRNLSEFNRRQEAASRPCLTNLKMVIRRAEQLKLLGLNNCFGAPVDF
ncbi:hypothetical protein D3C73_662030 [compost metagenome]